MTEATSYTRRSGALFRTVLNDLKRDEASAARELGVERDLIDSVLRGSRVLPYDLVERAAQVWPINERDLLAVHDDAPTGVRIMSAQESLVSTRVLRRGGVDYYEYRDTAMSRVSALRPEWIRMLQAVDDDDPNNPAVRWNNGHLLFQFTFFLEDTNYYYQWQGRRMCRRMSRGDSVVGLPYAPHSFASRNPDRPGLILALTYAGSIGSEAQRELGALGPELAGSFAPQDGQSASGFSSLLKMHMNNACTTLAQLSQSTGVSSRRLTDLAHGRDRPYDQERQRIARALGVAERDLLSRSTDTEDGVRFVTSQQGPVCSYPAGSHTAYRVRQLARSCVTPFARGLELRVPLTGTAPALSCGLHEYGYNHGSAPFVLGWNDDGQEREACIEPGDSFYIKPFVSHAFTRSPDSHEAARVLLLRVGGHVTGDAALEAAILGRAALRRAAEDAERWYHE